MIKKIVVTLLLSTFLFAGDLIELLPYKSNEFSPSLKQKFSIPFTLKSSADVLIKIYTPDNNLIRILKSTALKIGKNELIWDGKDNHGIVVPDEAYNIVVIAKNKENNQTIDMRETGGVVLKDLQTKVDKSGNINYQLSSPARVLVRAGIENGPMLRMISNWVPKSKGKIRQRWDMKSSGGLIDISSLNFVISLNAYALPKSCIITTNNSKLDYLAYIKNNNFTCKALSKGKRVLKRTKEGISKHYYKCRNEESDPRVFIDLSNVKKDEHNISILKNGIQAHVKVSMHPEDEQNFSKSKYEVSFFIDNQFTSEEELGFMPLSWNFTPNALKKGEHILTVNISSFSGLVGLSHYKFVVK